MNESLKPIETLYRGYRFRSRLEARWAVAFDAMGWQWEYEPQGFETSAGPYLPDFRVRDTEFLAPEWWEIKPAWDRAPDLQQTLRHNAFVELRWIELVRQTGLDLVVAHGLPDPDAARFDAYILKIHTHDDAGPMLPVLRVRHGCGLSNLLREGVRAARAARFEHHDSDATALR